MRLYRSVLIENHSLWPLKHLSRYITFVLIVVFSFMSLTSFAQQLKPQNEFWRNVRYGGALALVLEVIALVLLLLQVLFIR